MMRVHVEIISRFQCRSEAGSRLTRAKLRKSFAEKA
jgi:hypothetical protein